MDGQHKVKWTLYITLASMFIFVSVSEVGRFSSMKKSALSLFYPNDNHKYVVLFDGGSTGTRLHVFLFKIDSDGSFALKNDYFEEVKPGLSSYADKPRHAAVSIKSLLEKAKFFVPSNLWSETPVALKATAGLRLLPNSISDSILDAIGEVFQASPFMCEEKSVSVLDGDDEGLYAWITLNFLLGRLSNPIHSGVSLELGGGSTQITYTPTELETFLHSPKDYLIVTKVRNKTMPLYTHSYLGLGLMSARLSILKLSSDESAKSETNNYESYRSSCIPPEVSTVWKHDLNTYEVVGKDDKKYGFEECYNHAVSYLGGTVDRSREIQNREVYVMSYYADRAKDLGISNGIDDVITVGQFASACKKACSSTQTKEVFVCIDCSYIVALLHHGIGLDEKKEIKIGKYINGVTTSWGLGFALSMLN